MCVKFQPINIIFQPSKATYFSVLQHDIVSVMTLSVLVLALQHDNVSVMTLSVLVLVKVTAPAGSYFSVVIFQLDHVMLGYQILYDMTKQAY